MRFATWLLTNAAGLAAAAWLLDGISFTGSDWQDKLGPLLLTSLILGVITSFVKPVVQLLSLPLIILTVGLFLLIINALMLSLTGWIAEQLDIGFRVDDFWWSAVFGSIVITLVTWVVDSVVDKG